MKISEIDAVIFDLDGVITNSTPLHSFAWKQTFDQFLKTRAEQTNTPFREFTHEEDYLAYVDGKPRYLGVKSFLESRGFNLPFGDPTQEPDQTTICGLGNLKNEIYNTLLTERGVDIYPTSVEFIHELKDAGIPLGLATSSKNADRVLELTGLRDLFQTQVDGVVSAELGLEGKPAPDIFHTACDRLGAAYDRSVIIEDANSGVQAGYRGQFGLVLGVARENNKQELELHGADLVVEDLQEISLEDIRSWFSGGDQQKQWSIDYSDYESEWEGTRETLCAVGNGYFCTRGALEEIPLLPDENYPGTYIAGLYNRLESNIAGRTVSNEDFVNCPNWLPITFKIDSGEWFNPHQVKILEFQRILNFKTGVLSRTMVVRDQEGHQTRIQTSRLISMADPNLAAIQYQITPLNYAGVITVRAELDGTVTNQGVKRYRELSSRHLSPVEEGGEKNLSFLSVETNQSRIKIGLAAKLQVFSGEQRISPDYEVSTIPGKVSTIFEIEAHQDSPLCVEKTVLLYSSTIPGIDDPVQEARERIKKTGNFDQILASSKNAWQLLWQKIDLKITGDRLTQKMIRLHLYHSLVSVSPHSARLDAGIPARGLHGEAYRGHIFWDELYVMPFYDFHFPETARSALMYRYRRLPAAQQAAEREGFRGALFPWQSGSDGGEETQLLHLNPLSGEWGPDYSHLQRHVSLAIAYNLWNYYWITKDEEFLSQFGAELFLSISLFWSDIAEKNSDTGRFSISNVMGPDEFHETLPGSDNPGLRDNAYTNLMVAWVLNRAFDILEQLPEQDKTRIFDTLKINADELNKWKDIKQNLTIHLSEDGIIEQFQGYFNLQELDWEGYKKTYQNIHRMDRILKSEGLSPNDYKVAKQADALMLFYNLSETTVSSLLSQLGYNPPDNLLSKNLHYYLQRTSHGSTLSRLVHAYLADQAGNHELSWKLYQESLRSDFLDIQGGTTGEGIHLGVMTGTILFAIRTYAGLDWTGKQLKLNPNLSPGWKQMEFNLSFQGSRYYFQISPKQVKVKVESEAPMNILVKNQETTLTPGAWEVIEF